jgi:hypothetical protein
MRDELVILQSAFCILLWALVLVHDLRTRRIAILVLLALIVTSLIGQPWPWWIAAAVTLLWPKRDHALLPVAPAIGLGVLTNDIAPAMAIGAGAIAWALGWWGGADAIALLALGLRHGVGGLVAGALAATLAGAALMIARKRPALNFVPVLTEAMFLQKRGEVDIPADSEMPAAAALAVAGLLLEAARIIGLMTYNV